MKQTRVTFETREEIIVRRFPAEAISFCPGCGQETLFAAPEYFVALTGKTMREIFREIEAGAFHFRETEAGLALVCFVSFIKLFPRTTLEIQLLKEGRKDESI